MPAKNLKYIVVILITVPFVLFALLIYPKPRVSNAQSNFSDLLASHPNAFAIEKLKELGYVSGYPDGTFKPDQQVTRAEAVAIILKASGIKADGLTSKLSFTDVSDKDWFYPMIRTGVSLQKLKGYDDNTFRPNNPINLVEALATTLSFYRVRLLNYPLSERLYEGLNKDDWYGVRAQYAKDNNIIEPDENGKVEAGAILTRGQLSEMIYRTHIVESRNKPFDITRTWITSSNPDNYWKLSHPRDWRFFRGTANSVLWRPTANQAFFTRIFPDGAQVSISLLENGDDIKTAAQYFGELKARYNSIYGAENIKYEEGTTQGHSSLKISIPKHQITDFIQRLPNTQFLIMYGQYGDSALGDFLAKQVAAVIGSYEFVEKPKVIVVPLEERIQRLRENILFEGKSEEILNLFSDKKLIETDAIGIGTGAVDYFFSKEANMTIKVERGTKTILNTMQGETTKF